jgi:hypothetical protein
MHPLGKGQAQLLPPTLPVEVGSGIDDDQAQWTYNLTVKTPLPDSNFLSGKKVFKPTEGRGNIEIQLSPGENKIILTEIDPLGMTYDYEILAVVQKEISEVPMVGEPMSFLVGGMVFYSRSISREGTAIGEATEESAFMPAIRLIYRRRMFKSFSDLLPYRMKFFVDLSLVMGRTLSGDTHATGLPYWIDSRLTVEVYSWGRMRLETGFGATYFALGLDNPVPGDLTSFVGIVFSARVAYPLTERILGFAGANIATQGTHADKVATVSAQPIDVFLSGSYMLNPKNFLETRLRYFLVGSSGIVVNAGTVVRSERFMGIEFLWARVF